MKRTARPLLFLGGVATVGFVVWFSVPGPFVHGGSPFDPLFSAEFTMDVEFEIEGPY